MKMDISSEKKNILYMLIDSISVCTSLPKVPTDKQKVETGIQD